MTRKLLVVSPSFHGYHRSIGRSFERLGYTVDTYCYDVALSKGERLWNKLRHELPAQFSGDGSHMSADQASGRAIAAVEQSRADAVLVIRGDVLTEQFWSFAAQRAAVGVWLYDEVRRTRFAPDMVANYARIATYSALDAQAMRDTGIKARHVHLGFDDGRPVIDDPTGSGQVTFIGAPSPKRAEALQALVSAGVPVRAFGRGWSDHLIDKARTWRTKSIGLPNGRDVSGEVAQAIMRSSAATLNIHGDQDGFTMRTFEAAGVGAVQLVDRSDIGEVYTPGEEVLVFDGVDELVEIARRAVTRPQDFNTLRERARIRTLAEHTFVHRAEELQGMW